MKTRTLFAISVLALMGVEAVAFENTGLRSIQEGRAEYYCVLNRQNPKDKATYDQHVFAGGAFIGTNSESIIITPQGQILSSDIGVLDGKSLEEVKKLSGSIVAYMYLTPESEVESDLDRNITIGFMKFKDFKKAKPGKELTTPLSMATGYHRGTVGLVNENLKLYLTCLHKSRLGEK